MSANPLPRTLALLEQGIADHLHIGAQLYVSRNFQPITDVALGQSRPGLDLTRDTLMLWMSAGKPVTAIAVAQLYDQKKLDLDDSVARHIPEFAQHGKSNITIRHCLTHTAGLRGPLNNFTAGTWEQIIDRICSMRPEPHWTPGEKAGYHIATTWFILGEIVARLSSTPAPGHSAAPPRVYHPLTDYLRYNLFLPLGMTDAWIGMPVERYLAYGDQLALLPSTEKGDLIVNTPANTDQATIIPRPGANFRAPAHQFARFYETLLNGGTAPDIADCRLPIADSASATQSPSTKGANRQSAIQNRQCKIQLLSPKTTHTFTSPQRVGLHDHTFNAPLDWSLGFLVNSAPYAETTPYLYGPRASPKTFGHSGNQSSVAFADPEHNLVVALAFNGMPGEQAHQSRTRAVLTTLYEELDLARA
jgi:CubicO group peptidase (beta-lactamase class C family)